MRRLALGVLVLTGCTNDDLTIEHTVGRACAHALENPARINLEVDLHPPSGQCVGDAQATCTVTRTSYGRLAVSTELSGTLSELCTREVHRYTAYCGADLIANITQRIEVGDFEMTLELPGDYADALCVYR